MHSGLECRGLKTTETLLGIETGVRVMLGIVFYCLKTTETLLGIETSQIKVTSAIKKPSQNY